MEGYQIQVNVSFLEKMVNSFKSLPNGTFVCASVQLHDSPFQMEHLSVHLCSFMFLSNENTPIFTNIVASSFVKSNKFQAVLSQQAHFLHCQQCSFLAASIARINKVV